MSQVMAGDEIESETRLDTALTYLESFLMN